LPALVYYFRLDHESHSQLLWLGFSMKEEISTMKEGIHPDYKVTTIHCACGEAFQTRSTKENVKLDICSNCHPFYTGKQKLIDTEGRVDKFRKKYKKA
jgi:large subunit ribosomal protein L31